MATKIAPELFLEWRTPGLFPKGPERHNQPRQNEYAQRDPSEAIQRYRTLHRIYRFRQSNSFDAFAE